jgi:hypothetical protein
MLGHDARRLDENGELAELLGNGHGSVGRKDVPLGGEPVELLDSVLGIAAVAAHVPLPDSTGGARHRIGPPHDAHDEVSRREA